MSLICGTQTGRCGSGAHVSFLAKQARVFAHVVLVLIEIASTTPTSLSVTLTAGLLQQFSSCSNQPGHLPLSLTVAPVIDRAVNCVARGRGPFIR